MATSPLRIKTVQSVDSKLPESIHTLHETYRSQKEIDPHFIEKLQNMKPMLLNQKQILESYRNPEMLERKKALIDKVVHKKMDS